MKNFLSTLILFLVSSSFYLISAQDIAYPEKRVALAPLSFDNTTANKASAEKMYQYLQNALFNAKRFTLVDRLEGYKFIVFEKKLQETTDFIDGKVVAQGKLQGASLIIFAHLNTASASETKNSKGELTGYSGEVSLFVRIVDVETSQIIASQIITPNGITDLSQEVDHQTPGSGVQKVFKGLFSSTCSGQSPQSAIDACMNQTTPYVNQFVNNQFPLEMRIFRVYDGDKGQKVYWVMGAGEGHNLKKGNKLSVIRTQYIQVSATQKKRRVDEIMKLKITNADNGEFIDCEAATSADKLKEVSLASALKNDPTSISVIESK